jgi:hypothetical protein
MFQALARIRILFFNINFCMINLFKKIIKFSSGVICIYMYTYIHTYTHTHISHFMLCFLFGLMFIISIWLNAFISFSVFC